MLITAFTGQTLIASGPLPDVVRKARAVLERGGYPQILFFDDRTGAQIEIDLRESDETIRRRFDAGSEDAAPKSAGRPKLGVTAREVTLMPRHWEWLNTQPGGASAALRRLVEDARKNLSAKDRQRDAQNAAYRFMTAMAGNEPGFEDALRALFAGRQDDFRRLIAGWPQDIRIHTELLTTEAF